MLDATNQTVEDVHSEVCGGSPNVIPPTRGKMGRPSRIQAINLATKLSSSSDEFFGRKGQSMGFHNSTRKYQSIGAKLPRLARRTAAAAIALAILTSQWGCSMEQVAHSNQVFWEYFNPSNSFLNPSEVGRFDRAQPFGEARFVQLPILDTIDLVDQPVDHWANASDPTPADLAPENKEYVFGIGDTVGVSIYELISPGQSYERNSQITETGSINIQSLGNIPVIGLTPTQLEEKIRQVVVDKGILAPAGNGNPGPQVTVTLLGSRQRVFSILGAVGGPGTYNIISNDFRLLDALALARDVQVQPGMDYLFVIRQPSPGDKPAAPALPVPGASTKPGDALNAITDIEHNATGPASKSATDSAPATAPAKTLPTDSAPATQPGTKSGVRGSDAEPLPTLVRELPDSMKAGIPHAMVVAGTGRVTSVANDLDAALDATAPATTKAADTATAPAATEASAASAPATTTASTASRPHDTDLDAAMSQPSVDTAQYGFVEGKLVLLPHKTTTAPGGAVAVMTPTTGPNATASGPASLEPPSTETGAELLQTQRVIRIPIQALREGVSRYNIIVRPGDVINIPNADPGEFYLMGHVARPGVYTLTGRKVTLKQAVAAAGNLDSAALPRRCEFIRRVGPDQEVTIQVNLQAIFNGEQPDLFLKPNDVLNVGTDLFASLLAVTRNGYRASYGFGFVYDKNLDTSGSGNSN